MLKLLPGRPRRLRLGGALVAVGVFTNRVSEVYNHVRSGRQVFTKMPNLRLGRTTRSTRIREFLLDAVKSGKSGFVSDAAERFGVSRQTVHRHLSELVAGDYLIAEGSTRARKYRLGPVRRQAGVYDLQSIEEDVVYRRDFAFLFDDLRPNVAVICHYGFTEMVNNAIDHSQGTHVVIVAGRDHRAVYIGVRDNGEGIFKRVARLMNLGDPRDSLLELSKGKLTTDPEHHTGEGIFFTSRAFDYFAIRCGDLLFTHVNAQDLYRDTLDHHGYDEQGTNVDMLMNIDCERTMREVFDEFTEGDDFGFLKTVVPVRLALYEGERLVSRSQAKRLMHRVENFRTVHLDFQGVDFVGRAFVDEIFRIFRSQHPDIKLVPINMNKEVSDVVYSVWLQT